MGNVREYQSEPPPAADDDIVNPTDFSFKLVKVEVNNSKSGWSRFKFILPQSVRAMYAGDVVFGADWRAMCQEFDDRCRCCTNGFWFVFSLLFISSFLNCIWYTVKLFKSEPSASRVSKLDMAHAVWCKKWEGNNIVWFWESHRWKMLESNHIKMSHSGLIRVVEPKLQRLPQLLLQQRSKPCSSLIGLVNQTQLMGSWTLTTWSARQQDAGRALLWCWSMRRTAQLERSIRQSHLNNSSFSLFSWLWFGNFWYFSFCMFLLSRLVLFWIELLGLTEGPFSWFWGECEVAHMDITIPNDDFAICHGASRFVKNDKIADLKRKGKTGHRFVMWSQGSWMVLMCFPSCVSHMRLIQIKYFFCERIPEIMLFSPTH